MKKKNVISPRILTVIVVSAIVLFQFIYLLINKHVQLLFGVEYGNIAMSIFTGDGYGNPFFPSITGPTAWMPPFLTYLIYTGYLLFGGPTVSAFIFLSVLKILSFGVTFYVLVKTLLLVDLKVYPPLLIATYLLYFIFSPYDNFANIHDFWIVQILVALFIYSALKIYFGNNTYSYLLGAVLFITPFVNPGFALGFLIATFILLYFLPLISDIRAKRSLLLKDLFNRNLSRVLLITLAFSASVSVWSIRNYQTFGKFIPTKSNMWFEFYLSNIVDTDGQLSQSTTYRAHPIYNEDLQIEIQTKGEIEWMKQYEDLSKDFVQTNFRKYLKNIRTRLFNALIFIENDGDRIYSSHHNLMSDADLKILEENRHLVEHFWFSLYYQEADFRDILEKIEVEDMELILKDWQESKKTYLDKKHSLPNIVRSSFMALLPTLSILLMLLLSKYRKNPAIILTISLYIFYLLPYILISHQLRYQRPLFLLQVIFVYVAIIWTMGKLQLLFNRR